MKLNNNYNLFASCALLRGDHFVRNNVLLFMIDPGEYCVQKMDGPVTAENRVITRSWAEALNSFETFCG